MFGLIAAQVASEDIRESGVRDVVDVEGMGALRVVTNPEREELQLQSVVKKDGSEYHAPPPIGVRDADLQAVGQIVAFPPFGVASVKVLDRNAGGSIIASGALGGDAAGRGGPGEIGVPDVRVKPRREAGVIAHNQRRGRKRTPIACPVSPRRQ